MTAADFNLQLERLSFAQCPDLRDSSNACWQNPNEHSHIAQEEILAFTNDPSSVSGNFTWHFPQFKLLLLAPKNFFRNLQQCPSTTRSKSEAACPQKKFLQSPQQCPAKRNPELKHHRVSQGLSLSHRRGVMAQRARRRSHAKAKG